MWSDGKIKERKIIFEQEIARGNRVRRTCFADESAIRKEEWWALKDGEERLVKSARPGVMDEKLLASVKYIGCHAVMEHWIKKGTIGDGAGLFLWLCRRDS